MKKGKKEKKKKEGDDRGSANRKWKNILKLASRWANVVSGSATCYRRRRGIISALRVRSVGGVTVR